MRNLITSIIGIAIVLCMITGAAAVAGTSFASKNNNDETINLTGGKLIVKKADDLTINLVAQQGEKGEKGDKGDPGANGQDGLPGANGQDGAPGLNGVDGKDGVNGTNGLDGQDGTTLPDETIAAINDLQNKSAVLSTVYDLYQNGSLSSVLICYAAENGTDNCSPIPVPAPSGNVTDNSGNTTEPVVVGNVTEPQ